MTEYAAEILQCEFHEPIARLQLPDNFSENVCGLHDICEDEMNYYVVMERVNG